MPIYAKPADIMSNITYISQPIENGQSLVFDSSTGFFINKKVTVDLTGSVTSAKSIGGENAISVLKQKTDDGVLEFYNLYAGTGINLTLDNNNNIIFSLNNQEVAVSVTDDYTIVIDNDGNNPDASFNIKTVSNLSHQEIPITITYPVSANNLLTGNETGRGYVRSIDNVDFVAGGLATSMIISLVGTPDQDGIFIIDEVETIVVSGTQISTIYFGEEFDDELLINLDEIKNPSLLTQGSVWVPDNDGQYGVGYSNDRLFSLQFWGVDLGPMGHNLLPGMIITIIGSEDGLIDGTYEISQVFTNGPQPAVLWSGVIFTSNTPLPAGLTPGIIFDNDVCNNQLRIIINQFVGPTGFTVNTLGEVSATRYFSATQPTLPNELTTKQYVDETISSAVSVIQSIALSAINAKLVELENRIKLLEKGQSKPLRYYLNNAKY